MSLPGLKCLPHTAEMISTQPPTYGASVTWVGSKVTPVWVPCEGPPFSPHPRVARGQAPHGVGQGLPCPGRGRGSHNRLNNPGCCPHPPHTETMCPVAPLTQGRALVCGPLDGPWGRGISPLRPEHREAWQCWPGVPSGCPSPRSATPTVSRGRSLASGLCHPPSSAVTSRVQGSALNPSLSRFI